MRKEYKIIISSSSQNFFLSFYLLLRYLINKKLNRKKIKKGKLTKEYKEFIQKNLKIGEDWFTHNINNLDLIFKKKQLYSKELSMLELGSYEGNSSVFFLKYFQKIKLTCVDTFEGSIEQGNKNFDKVFENFKFNTKNYKDRVEVFRLKSKEFFKNTNDSNFDLIYIDGSHYAKDVFEDATNSFDVLNKNGYIIFDDFLWDFYENINDNPIGGVKLFIKKNFFKLKIISIGYQIIIQKI